MLYINLLEHHSECCRSCELLLLGRLPLEGICSRGLTLANLILRHFVVETDGRVYSTNDDFGTPAQVEISRDYWATHGLLKGSYPWSYKRHDMDMA